MCEICELVKGMERTQREIQRREELIGMSVVEANALVKKRMLEVYGEQDGRIAYALIQALTNTIPVDAISGLLRIVKAVLKDLELDRLLPAFELRNPTQ